ncbi:anthranilate synthase component I [Kordiimonas sp. SCSIO 12603]|uniref:anthranilate synthase component I n=1 Tax=Kordiimonas sp. SCSIO 12603 TaxID=2829596 RepID=UPI002103DA21|nr:anthranilate synthase component I [Kordiimonas sp. SCSIO 12603]UTW57465.1 anthranilate synthase component I [Kordiimonas sp. SCSIO 12603]
MSDFKKRYNDGQPQVVFNTLVADLDTPVSAYIKLSQNEKHSFLLESVEGGETRGRYSIIGLKPDLIWRNDGSDTEVCRNADEPGENTFESMQGHPLQCLREILAESLIDLPHPLPPMAAGLVGHMGYDMVRQMEDIGTAKPDPLGMSTSIFVRPTVMAVFDSVTNLVTLVTPVRPKNGISADEALAQAEARIDAMLDRLDAPLPLMANGADISEQDAVSNTSRDQFHEMVTKAQEYILAGDIFQVVLSQRFTMPFELPPFALYRALRRTNPSPFMYHLAFDDFAIVGSSPEILVRLRDEDVTIRPIAGTRKRGLTPEEDEALAADLLADQKELSEHLMLLDLGRNDVGRVSKPGSVEVTARNTIELYSHVMHIVSNVVGVLDPKYDAIDALSAGFPAGTVSGAPKVRAMEIIDELEVDARGPYAGSVGYFSANGMMDTCIVLRTAVVKDGKMHVQAGAGVVADSDPESEYQECHNKARALVVAAKEAIRFARSNRG